MTACVNKKHTRRVALAISASLVGALSLGAAAPAVANAAEIETLVGNKAQDFSNGSVTVINGGVRVTDNTYTTTATGGTIQVVPNWFKTSTGDSFRVDEDGSNYEVDYVTADEDGEPTDVATTIKDPGTYFVRITARGGEYDGGVAYMKVVVKAANLGSLQAYEVNPSKENDANDIDFYYTGRELNVGIKNVNGHILEEGVDYSVKFLKDGDSIDDPGVEVKDAGKYYAVVTGLGKYAGKTATLPTFTVNHFTLNDIDGRMKALIEPVIGSNAVPTIASVTFTDGSYVTSIDPSVLEVKIDGIFGEAKQYSATVSVKGGDNDNISGSITTTVDKYDHEATFGYDGGDWVESMVTDLSAKKPTVFQYRSVEAYDGEDALTSGEVSIYVMDANGAIISTWENGAATGDANWNTEPGTYTVMAVAGSTDHQAGGTVTCTVKVTKGTVDADASVYVTYKGDVTTGVTTDWTTAGISLGDFDVVGKDSEGTDISSELTFEVTDSEGNVVKRAITDAGEYTLTVKSDAYDLTGTTSIAIKVNKLDLTDLTLSIFREKFGYTYLYMEGSSDRSVTYLAGLTQYLQGIDADGDGELNDWANVPVSILDFDLTRYDSESGEWVDVNNIPKNTEGVYRLTVSPKTDEAELNCSFASESGTTLEFRVVDEGKFTFSDVTPDHWAFDSVAKAADNVYIKGIYGTDYYRPDNQITRADAAIVVARMAGVDDKFWNADGTLSESGLQYAQVAECTFSDVEVSDYYAAVIGWAYSVDVVNGDANADTFRPDESITREEFAAILSNYAALNGEDISVDADEVLADANGADTVSPWMRDAVAWAYDNGVMGNNGASLNGQGNITRAETAAMAVNYQPEKLK